MPWKECHVMDERLRFVARLLEGEKMAPLCAEFGISRKTGYKIFDRYKDCGVQAFSDRSHRAHRQANRLPAPIEATIVQSTPTMVMCSDDAWDPTFERIPISDPRLASGREATPRAGLGEESPQAAPSLSRRTLSTPR